MEPETISKRRRVRRLAGWQISQRKKWAQWETIGNDEHVEENFLLVSTTVFICFK